MARSTFPSKNVQNTTFRALLEVEMLKKCTPLWREAHFEVKSQKCKKLTGTEHFWTFRCRFAWQARGILHLANSEQNMRVFVAVSKTMASVGHLKRIWKDACRVTGAVQETHEVDVLGDQGGDFLRGVAFWST